MKISMGNQKTYFGKIEVFILSLLIIIIAKFNPMNLYNYLGGWNCNYLSLIAIFLYSYFY